ncbi:ATP-grasp domain-containing protein [Bacillus cereus]
MCTKRILLTGARAPVSVDIARKCKLLGWEVYMADSISHAIGKYSNNVKKYYEVPSPRFETEGYISSLKNIIKENEIDLLIPTCEEVFYISKFKDELGTTVFVDSFDKLDRLHDKKKFSEETNNTTLKTPETWLVKDQEELNKLFYGFEGEYIIKPSHSRFSMYIENWDSTKKIPKLPPERFPYVVQRFIHGTQWCSFALARNGVVYSHVSYKTVYAAGKGATIHFKFEENIELRKFTEEMCKSMCFTGQIAFDFIQGQDGTFYPIECNPRTTSGMHLIPAEHLHLKTPCSGGITKEKQISMAMLGTLHKCKNWSERRKWFKDLKKADDVLWDMDDPKPYLYQFVSLWKWLEESKEHKIPLLAATTRDIEWNGEFKK